MPPSDGRGDLVTRNERGLLPRQQELLEALADNPDWRSAAEQVGIAANRVRRWLREDDAFRREYEDMFQGATEVARLRVESASEEAVDTLFDLLAAEKVITTQVHCPQCSHKFDASIRVENANVRAKAAEIIMKASGVLIDRRKIEHEGEVLHLTFTQKVALAQLRAHQPISEQMLLEFQSMGLVDAAGNLAGSDEKVKRIEDPNVIDGESHRIDEGGIE